MMHTEGWQVGDKLIQITEVMVWFGNIQYLLLTKEPISTIIAFFISSSSLPLLCGSPWFFFLFSAKRRNSQILIVFSWPFQLSCWGTPQFEVLIQPCLWTALCLRRNILSNFYLCAIGNWGYLFGCIIGQNLLTSIRYLFCCPSLQQESEEI